MPMEDDGNLEELLTPQPPAEASQEGAVTEVQSESTPQPQVSQAQPEPVASSLPGSLASRAKAAGLQLDGITSADQLAEQVLDRYLQDRAYADYGRSSLAKGQSPQGGQGNEEGDGQAEDGTAQAEFDESGHFSNLWKVTELDDACKFAIQNGIVTLGEDGMFQAKPGYETMALPLLQTINQSHLGQKEQVGKLFEGNFYQNVDKGLWPAFEARLNRMLDERLNSQFQSYEQQVTEKSFIDTFVNDNKAWLYDSTGQ